jgi:hypothetical protein
MYCHKDYGSHENYDDMFTLYLQYNLVEMTAPMNNNYDDDDDEIHERAVGGGVGKAKNKPSAIKNKPSASSGGSVKITDRKYFVNPTTHTVYTMGTAGVLMQVPMTDIPDILQGDHAADLAVGRPAGTNAYAAEIPDWIQNMGKEVIKH